MVIAYLCVTKCLHFQLGSFVCSSLSHIHCTLERYTQIMQNFLKFKLKDDVLYTHYIVCGDRESAPSATEFTASLQPGPSNPSASIAASGLFLALSITYKRAH